MARQRFQTDIGQTKTGDLQETKFSVAGVYVHIPFCAKICPFCSFPVIKDKPLQHDEYLELVYQEISLLRQEVRLDFSKLKSVYFGGGTPSRIPLDRLGRLANRLRSEVETSPAPTTSWSIEINPEDITSEYASELKNHGFSRVSLGIQSFQVESLKKLGRAHTPEDSRRALDILRKAGFENINLDLMFGYPGQSKKSLIMDLREFLSQSPAHISAYCLNVEKKTAIFRKPEWREWQEKNEDLIVEMSLYITKTLRENGFQQYETSNFSKKGRRSHQNLINWKRQNYLGLGAGAHSFISPFRWGNHKRRSDYRKALLNGYLPLEYREKLSASQQKDEDLMLSLRLTEGLTLPEFFLKHNARPSDLWENEIKRLKSLRLVELDKGRLKLTDKGMSLADEITAILAALIN